MAPIYSIYHDIPCSVPVAHRKTLASRLNRMSVLYKKYIKCQNLTILLKEAFYSAPLPPAKAQRVRKCYTVQINPWMSTQEQLSLNFTDRKKEEITESTKTTSKTLITQRLRTDFWWSVGVTTVIKLVWLNWFTGSQPPH